MTSNPYAAQSDDFGRDIPHEAPRMSALAIVALVLSLICFIPGLPAIGSTLGVFALISIGRSGGRVKGTGLAIAGIILGLLFSMLQIGIAMGTNWVGQQYARFGEPMVHIQANDGASLRDDLTANTREEVTDADIAAFRAAYLADAGEFKGVPKGLFKAIQQFSQMGQAGTVPDQNNVPYAGAIPLAGQFDNGERLIWVAVPSNEEMRSDENFPATVNVGVTLSDGTVVWLVDPIKLQSKPGSSAPTTPAVEGESNEGEPAAEPDAASAEESAPESGEGGGG